MYEHKIAVCTCEEVQNYRLAIRTHQSSLDRTANTQSKRLLKGAFSSDSHVLTRIRSHRAFRPARRIPITTGSCANPRISYRTKSLSATHSFVNGALNTC
jgi:hypothetical protein